jgi:DNA-binding CsgD family transcriptional regulator/tetratricopeptide (TPR) repeat protein
MLLGREAECAAVGAVIDNATDAGCAVLVVRGPLGSGKTALLEWGVARAASMRTVVVAGSEREQSVPWSAVRAMTGSLDDQLGGLAPEQRLALAAGPDEAFATVAMGLLALVSIAARRRPVLLVVDDAHLVDERSLYALRFVAQRIDHDPVVLLVAEEPGERGTGGCLPTMTLPGLSPIDAVTLLADTVDTAVAQELARLTEGNPLAMLEIANGLTPAQRRGAEPLGPVLPLGSVLVRNFERTLEALSAEQRRLLVAAAAEPDLTVETLAAAAVVLGIDARIAATVMRPGLLRMTHEQRLRFERPGLREAAYEGASEDERRTVHAALAGVCVGNPVARAWHLAASVPGPDRAAADALEAIARDALARGEQRAAGDAWRRAADLTDDPCRRIARLAAAGGAYAVGDLHEAAIGAFDQAIALAGDGPEAMRLQIALAASRLAASGTPDGFTALAELADRVEASDRRTAAELGSIAAMTALAAGDLRAAGALAARARERHGDSVGRSACMADAVEAIAVALAGDRARAVPLLLASVNPSMPTWRTSSTLVFEDLVAGALAWVGESSASSRVVEVVIEQSRERDAVSVLSRALAARADLYFRTGYWDAALADATHAVDLARDLRVPGPTAYALAVTSRLEAALGRLEDAQRHGLEAVATAEQAGLTMNAFWARAALGFLAVGTGDVAASIPWLEAAREYAAERGVGLLAAVPWAPDLVEAYVRSGRTDDARQVVDDIGADADAQGPLPSALVARARALVATDGVEDLFRRALDAHSQVLSPFEQARTQLVYGEWLRRERRITEAESVLEAAATTFEHLRATPWRARAVAEQAARGRRTRPAERSVGALTPQEYRVASTVAAGATNREAAATLFLSPRTVEHHLATVYRKLGVRSRSELARRFATEPDFASGRSPADA